MTIVIEGYHYWSDWTTMKKVKVEEAKVCGFEIHYRGDKSWHIVVKPREGLDFEIEHGVPIGEVIDLLQNPKAKILKIVNYHVLDSFIKELKGLFEEVKP